MTFDGEPLFHEEFQAWAHGPVCPELWKRFKIYGSKQGIHLRKGTKIDYGIFTPEQKETLDVVWDAYSRYDAKFLEHLTHKEDPWKLARCHSLPGDYCDEIITHKSMKDFYEKLKG